MRPDRARRGTQAAGRRLACAESPRQSPPNPMRVVRWLKLSGGAATLLCWLIVSLVTPTMFGDVRITRVQFSANAKGAGFTTMPASHTSIHFSNQLADRAVLKNQNLMLGSGVAAGDFDGDGWCDLYFCAVNRSNTLYRNRGGWKFEDVSDSSAPSLTGPSTGAVFADIDGDGDLDLLVSSLGHGVRL